MLEWYKLINGVRYEKDIDTKAMEALEYARLNHIRIRILYGDTKLNTIWNHTETGYIHKTAGETPQPVIVNSSGKFSLPKELYQSCIMQIEYANKKDGGVLYEYKPQ